MSLYDPNKDWFKKWMRLEPHVLIGGDEDPYLKRWLVLPRNKFRINIYLHKFCRSDEDRALHDHPWPWWSFIIWGTYTEHFEGGSRRRPTFSLARRPATDAHRVELDPIPGATGFRPRGKPVWTLFITGQKQREWGFHCDPPVGWRHWEKFTQGGSPTDATGALGCDEERVG